MSRKLFINTQMAANSPAMKTHPMNLFVACSS